MKSRNIFSITGRENVKKNSSYGNNGIINTLSVILCNNYWNGLHVISILCSCSLTMSILFLIPRHNSIIEQSYWFEVFFSAGLWSVIYSAKVVMDLKIFTEMDSLTSIYLFLKVSFVSLLTWVATTTLCYIVWTIILEYNHPIPFLGTACVTTTIIALLVVLWLLSPVYAIGKKLLKNYMFFALGVQMLYVGRVILSKIFESLENTEAQFIMALVIPICKICTKSILSKLMLRITGTDNERANVLLAVTVNYFYSLFVAIKLVGARTTTVISMAMVEFLMQSKMTYQILRLHMKLGTNGNKKIKEIKRNAIQTLVLSELCEGLVPLAYAIGFAMAYYGPNVKLFGNVGNAYWQFQVVDDAGRTFLMMFGMFTLDFFCLSLNAGILWFYSKTNIFVEFCSVLQEYWYIMALKLVNNIYFDFISNDVNLGVDLTFKFDWITRDEGFPKSSNLTDI